MKQPTPIAAALTAISLLVGTAPVRAQSNDQASACGAILCLIGGSGVAECAGYLARYFAITAETPKELIQRRLDFLNLCPATDLPGDLLPLIANDGATCQPPQLVSDLNQQIRACEARTDDCHKNCRPTGQEWSMCATFYAHPYTTYEAPQLHEVCGQEYGDNGYPEQRCTYIWTLAGEATPTWDQIPHPENCHTPEPDQN